MKKENDFTIFKDYFPFKISELADIMCKIKEGLVEEDEIKTNEGKTLIALKDGIKDTEGNYVIDFSLVKNYNNI